jgi:hypothetical protein
MGKTNRAIVALALLSALMMASMLAVSLLNGGVTAQDFELLADPQGYAQAILAAGAPLRLILTFDNLFVIFYSALFIFLAKALWKKKLRLLIGVALAALLITSYLDFIENHELISFLAAAKLSLPVELSALHERVVWSQLKFHSTYLGLFLLAFALPENAFLEKLLRWSLWAVFPVIGVLVYTFPHPYLDLSRYVFMLSGFLLLAWNFSRLSRQP